MGLLGDSIEDPRTLAVLRAVGALQNQRGGGFGGLLSGLNAGGQDYIQTIAAAKQQEEARRLQAEQRQMQQQLMQQQLDAAKSHQAERAAAQATQQKDEGLSRRLLGMPIESQMPQGMQGPGAPMQNNGIDPRAFLNQGGSLGGLQGAMQLSQALNPPRAKP